MGVRFDNAARQMLPRAAVARNIEHGKRGMGGRRGKRGNGGAADEPARIDSQGIGVHVARLRCGIRQMEKGLREESGQGRTRKDRRGECRGRGSSKESPSTHRSGDIRFCVHA